MSRRFIDATSPRPLAMLVLGTLTVLLVSAACEPLAPVPGAEPYLRSTLELRADGTLTKGKLREPTLIDGRLCRDWVHWSPDGTLRGCELEDDTHVGPFVLPAGTILWFDAHGALETAWLARDTVLDGHLCRGGAGKIATGFHAAGGLASFFSRDDVSVGGVPCRGSVFHPIRLHPDGTLAAATLAADWTLGGVELSAGTGIRLDRDGRLVAADD